MGNPQPREHFHGKGPHGPSRSDERIRVAVNEALYHDRRVDAREVMVEVRNGEVTLTGTVNDREMKQRTEECVWQVHGVRQVNDMLRVEEDESRRPHRDRERWH
jgi:osmotically-inducible protein OsmY